VSAIYDAIFAARAIDISGCTLFSTHFPNLDDVKLIVATGVTSVYFFGLITDQNAVTLINNLKDASIPLELIALKPEN